MSRTTQQESAARSLTRRFQEEQGFTLIELLVVVLIIGILAAIALPVFLGQQQKGQDADAKSNARNLVTQIESCFTDTQDYTQCMTTAALSGNGMSIGTSAGQVSASASSPTAYTVIAYAKSGNQFQIAKSGSSFSHSCTTAGQGSCPASGSW